MCRVTKVSWETSFLIACAPMPVGASRNKYLVMPTKRSGGMRREEIQLGGHDFAEDFRSVGSK